MYSFFACASMLRHDFFLNSDEEMSAFMILNKQLICITCFRRAIEIDLSAYGLNVMREFVVATVTALL